jgi:hypothetical protein
MPTFKPHHLGETRRRSLAVLIELLLANKGLPDVLEKHIRDLLDTALWKYTEADGKYKTRYQSAGALQCKDESQLRHEHVYPRSKLIDALMRKPEESDQTLILALGCTVTNDEHGRLTPFDKKHKGWDRYRQAAVTVFDMQTGKEHSLDEPPNSPF